MIGKPIAPFPQANTTITKTADDIRKTIVDVLPFKKVTRQSPTAPISPEIVRGWLGNCNFFKYLYNYSNSSARSNISLNI